MKTTSTASVDQVDSGERVSPLTCVVFSPSSVVRLLTTVRQFVTNEDVRILRDIEQFFATQIDEMPVNIGEVRVENLHWLLMSC